MVQDGRTTLVLDASYRPMHAIGWRRAMVLDLLDRVDVLEYYDDVVRTASDVFPLPAVIRLRAYVEKRRRAIALTRRNILARDDARCQYCMNGSIPLRRLTLDHVIPRSRGGPTSWENLVIACDTCNRRKGNRTPREASMPLNRVPRRPTSLQFGRDGMIGVPPVEWANYLPR